MKKTFLFPTLAILGLLFIQGTSKSVSESEIELHAMAPDMPANVKAVVEQKCYGCHNAESKNEKGKAKLDWDAFEATKKSKQLATMAKINETLAKGEMPPAKFLENKPEGKLSESDLATLMEWSAGKKKSN
ncbi:heme-binding domain-containing protein [Cognataquiflexum rubidum]|uniref:heme-binding domain-containing protein n=1 Tax=Cognataquiflexum rubidum TaxID=2922273 RepID=UPI001F14401F|nr:heme-binding domain-containing protein [Cognataquiflexum rubidum]MCH6236238.1 heme-binding domain-containing protein [Cognataquiflexum rubidum]